MAAGPGKFRQFLGITGVHDNFIAVLKINICYLIFTNLQTMFVNTLFIKLTGDSAITMRYNTIVMFLSPIFIALFVGVMRKLSAKHNFFISVITYLIMYITFFAVMEKLDTLMPLIAVMYAIGQSSFFITYTNAVSTFSGEDNMDQTIAIMSMARGVVSLIMPFLSGLIITRFVGLQGYYIVFGISALVALLTLYQVIRMPAIKFKDKSTQYRKMLRAAAKSPLWKPFVVSELLKGFRMGVFNFFLNVLLYMLIQNEMLIGVNNAVVGITAIFGSWLCSHLMRPNNRMKMTFMAVCMLIVTTSLLYFQLGVVTIIIFGGINSFFNCFIENGSSSIFYLSVKKTPGGSDMSAEFIVLSQFCMGFGGAIGSLVITMLPQTATWTVTGMMILIFVQLFGTYLLNVIQKHMNRMDREEQNGNQANAPARQEAASSR